MDLVNLLKKNADKFGLVLSIDYRNEPIVVFDFTGDNPVLADIDTGDCASFDTYTKNIMQEAGVKVGIGRYMENRVIYDHSTVFSGENRRTVHTAIDIWVDAGTEVLCPFEGKVHSFAFNDAKGDYGPAIILEHELEGTIFYTLYGHLSLDSLDGLYVGKVFAKGDVIARVGDYPVNGDWPPHLHFQIIADMKGMKGDYPGVCRVSDVEEFKKICPHPNLILQIKDLD